MKSVSRANAPLDDHDHHDEAPIDAEVVPERGATEELLDRPGVILALLFLVAGALGLPFLWKSRGFGRPMKVFLSVVVIVYTFVLLWITKMICLWSYGRVRDAWETM